MNTSPSKLHAMAEFVAQAGRSLRRGRRGRSAAPKATSADDRKLTIPASMLLSPYCSDRPPNTRWLRAKELARDGSAFDQKIDDDWIRRATAYLRMLAIEGDGAGQDAGRVDPDIAAAHQLRTSSDSLRRATVEARLLARQSFQEVAAVMGMPAGVIKAYEALFY